MNIIAAMHAWKFTHFSEPNSTDKINPLELSFAQKLKVLLIGLDHPKPVNNSIVPSRKYQTFFVQSNYKLSCWRIDVLNAKGTVILFHGYGGQKALMLDKAEIFNTLGYNTVLVDFAGAGDSEGNQVSIGYYEADQVKAVFDICRKYGDKKIILFGTSMGAAAIMRSIAELNVKPEKVILECPFGTMYQTVCARFKEMNIPSFPMASLLVFWGGSLNGFNAFTHNPETYAKSITCPMLFMYGAIDPKVSLLETENIFKNAKGQKKLVIFKNTGHENYLMKNEINWRVNILDFIE